jgi:hypothetical protein
MGWEDEEPILEQQVYRDAFERVAKEVFTRLALAAPAAAPAPVQAAVAAEPAPAAPGAAPATN